MAAGLRVEEPQRARGHGPVRAASRVLAGQVLHYDDSLHDDLFDFGDGFSMDEDSDIHSLKELEIQTSR